MKTGRLIFILLLLLSISCLSLIIYQTNNTKTEIKEDLIELSNIKYGLFSVEEWKNILTKIITKKIETLELKGNNRKQMKKKVSDFLYKAIADFESDYNQENSGTVGGIFKNIGARAFNVFGRIKERVPQITNQILDFLDDPKNKKALKGYLTSKLNEYADSTFSKLDYGLHDSIISKYKQANRAATISLLNIKLDELRQTSNMYKYYLTSLALVMAIFIFIVKVLTKTEFILLTCICFLFLILGLTLPMIEIDARVSEVKISLLGEQVSFQDQVLYYKSKSILEVVKLMITQSSFDLLGVGFLVFVFSVLFPLSKLISSIFLILNPDQKSNKLLHFLVYKTGKWSMADVMIVAIFMAYLGFSGILTEQLHQIENISSRIEVLTTNKSSLQTGFFAFTSFAILSLLITNKLKNNPASVSIPLRRV